MKSKAQVIYCKCNKLYAATVEPHCYTSNSWLRDIKKAANKGHTIKMINAEDVKFEECTCK